MKGKCCITVSFILPPPHNLSQRLLDNKESKRPTKSFLPLSRGAHKTDLREKKNAHCVLATKSFLFFLHLFLWWWYAEAKEEHRGILLGPFLALTNASIRPRLCFTHFLATLHHMKSVLVASHLVHIRWPINDDDMQQYPDQQQPFLVIRGSSSQGKRLIIHSVVLLTVTAPPPPPALPSLACDAGKPRSDTTTKCLHSTCSLRK